MTFDAPSHTFGLVGPTDADLEAVLQAIRTLGYEPTLLEVAPVQAAAVERVESPESSALQAGLRSAAAREVPLVVALGGTFCRLSAEFAETTLKDERVATELDAVEFMRVDVDEDRDAAQDLDIHGVPAFRVLDGKGRALLQQSGWLDAEAFLVFLERARDAFEQSGDDS